MSLLISLVLKVVMKGIDVKSMKFVALSSVLMLLCTCRRCDICLFCLLNFLLDRLELFFFRGETTNAAVDASADNAVDNVAALDLMSSHTLFDIVVTSDAIGMGMMVPHTWFGPFFLLQFVVISNHNYLGPHFIFTVLCIIIIYSLICRCRFAMQGTRRQHWQLFG